MAPYHTLVSGPLYEALLDSPAAEPPPGQVNDLNAANWFGAANYVCLVLFVVVNTVAILVRFFTQHFILKGLVLEDYIALIAWIFQIVENVTGFICIGYGAGKHMWDLTIRDAMQIERYANYVGIMYGLSAWFIKLAILLQFLRIFSPGAVNKPMWYACWTWIVLNSVYYLVDTLTQVLQCLPREKIWNPFIEGGHCLSQKDIWMATGVFTVVSDFAILLLPLPIIFRLHLALRKKVLLLAVFTSGIIACVASTVRTYYTWRTFTDPDRTYWIIFIGIWTWIEMCIGLLIFSMPTLPQFMHWVHIKALEISANLRSSGPLSRTISKVNAKSDPLSSSSGELSQSTTPSSVEKGAGGGSDGGRSAKIFPWVDISLASFEQRPTTETTMTTMRRENAGIHVTRSVSMMTEMTEETGEHS